MALLEELTEGELYISYYLKEERLKYKSQYRIDNLKYDSKAYRISDFYLPNYKTHIEFCGNWNTNQEQRERYKEKIKAYSSNGIPCVFIFPENLGTIEFSFRYRLMKELKKHNLNRELFRFQLKRYWRDLSESVVYFLIAIASILGISIYNSDGEWFWQTLLVISGIAVFQFIKLLIGYFDYFID